MYKLPSSTLIQRIVPKKTFIDQLGPNARMKEHFTNDILRIEWLAKLVPTTINVADGKEVHEISVFLVPLKNNECPNDIFSFIDSSIPRHVLFVLTWGEQACLHINYKESTETTGKSDKVFHITKTYRSEWVRQDELAILIDGLNMDSVYESLVRQVAGERIIAQSEDLRYDVELSNQREALQKQLELLRKKVAAEKQPQKKFALYQQLNQLKELLN